MLKCLIEKIWSFIGNKTEKIRYKFIFKIIKAITPVLYTKIVMIYPILYTNWSSVPRPSIKIMREMFNKKQVIGAEIGVQKGINAESILKELNIKKLYLIDSWYNYKEYSLSKMKHGENYKIVLNKFEKNEKVQIIKDFSENAVNQIDDNSLDFVYIDGNHLYEYVYQDISLWVRKVREGGFVAGHDILLCSGVSKAVSQFCSENNYNFHMNLPDWYFVKE